MKEVLFGEDNGSISFGDYTLAQKTKKENFEYGGDVYKVKTFHEITKLEKNGLFVYESVPGSTVSGFVEKENGVSFQVSSGEDIQITLELAESTLYELWINGEKTGEMESNRSGKLSFNVESAGTTVTVKVIEK